MNKIDKIMAKPKNFQIEGIDVSIETLDFEDTMNLMNLKKNSKGEIDTSDNESQVILKKLMIKKLKQSLTEVKDGENIIPTDEKINKISMSFYTKYMKKLFNMGDDVSKKAVK